MTDANVDNLIRKVGELVVRDTGGVLFRPPAVGQDLRDRLEPLADNLDVPARLAPTVPAALGRGSASDPRADVRASLTELVALCADSLEPPDSLPEPNDPEHRTRLAAATSRAYAAFATPRLAPQLFANGRADDLGRFPPPQLEGDVAAARAMALAISARTGIGEESALTELVADGHGAAAPTAARLLLRPDPEYLRLPEDQQGGIVRHLARDIEADFADRDVEEAAFRELTVELEARREDVSGGAGVIDKASATATRELGKLHALLQRTRPPQLEEVRGIVAEHLVTRVEHHAGFQTGLTADQTKEPATATAAAANTMVLSSTIPSASRPEATAATATMITEGFDELPALMAEWRADGSDVRRQAELFGSTLGDRTMTAVRGFERQPPQPAERAQSFAADPAIPPLRSVRTGESRRTDDPARPRTRGSDGLTR
ncbi:hypothetical protein [Kribbella sp. HUAS MG21]|uniref:DUF222 domain-containing protein n=1 Tax=Kribbella sp. HUAS MG21 TaxID=3160966 RepID=A0AAU7TFJ6_9ACTN